MPIDRRTFRQRLEQPGELAKIREELLQAMQQSLEIATRLEEWEQRLVDREIELDERERKLLDLPEMPAGAMALTWQVEP